MRITDDHLTFWQDKKAGRPRWSQRSTEHTPVSIHRLINSQVGDPWSAKDGRALASTLAFVRMRAKREPLEDALRGLLGSTSPSRQAWCRRWLRKIERAERTDWVVVITHDHEDDTVQWQHSLRRHDLVDEHIYAKMYADECGLELAPRDGRIPKGCADFTVTIYSHPDDIGGVKCWSSQSFFFAKE